MSKNLLKMKQFFVSMWTTGEFLKQRIKSVIEKHAHLLHLKVLCVTFCLVGVSHPFVALPGMFHSVTLNNSTLYLFNFEWFCSSKIFRKTNILTVSGSPLHLSFGLVWSP
ncbi:hypothetical protein NL108_007556 [Boleophthalmus pectinirostris]|nr:hypothetical protein NL108_007556 [Boleophthalmus pectinirostris]